MFDDVKKRFIRGPSQINSGPSKAQKQRTFMETIVEEIEEELREDAELFVIKKCKEKYRELIEMGYFKMLDDEYKRGGIDAPYGDSRDEEFIWQRERVTVMSAILNPIDDRNYKTTIAVVSKDGEHILTKEFLHLLPPRSMFKRDQEGAARFPATSIEEDEHERNCNQLREILRD